MRIVVAGGGSGGHVTPTLAVCQALQTCALSQSRAKSKLEVVYIGSGDSRERDLVEAAGFTYNGLPTGKFRRYNRGLLREITDYKTVRDNLKDARKFLVARGKARAMLQDIQPDVVFAKGGFVGLPVGQAAAQLKIPLIIHESDTVMGLANRWLAKSAQIIATGFPVKHFANIKSKARLVHTGNPVRQELLNSPRPSARQRLRLNDRRPVIAIIGGSLGSQAINSVVWKALPSLTTQAHVWHQTGQHGLNEAIQFRHTLTENQKASYHPADYWHDELADIYAAADIVISRCGASVISELGLLQKPTIFIPMAGSANNHQVINAQFILNHGAGRVILEAELTPAKLQSEVQQLINSPADRQALAKQLQVCTKKDAALKIAKLIIRTAQS